MKRQPPQPTRPLDAGTDPSRGLPDVRRIARPARKAIDAIQSGVSAAADGVHAAADGVAAVAEPIVDRVQEAIEDVGRSWHERPGARVRRVRRMARRPLPGLYVLHPEARNARPVQVGLRTIDVADIAGTAVGGGDQRGGDFLPLKPFRGHNWMGRWQRLRRSQESLAILPPIDVVKYDGRYWVMDGHNRVALALYGGQAGIDANVTELIPMGGQRTEPIGSLAASAAESRSVRTAGAGHRPSDTLSLDEPLVTSEPKPDDLPDDRPGE
jgi:hypothetical protein